MENNLPSIVPMTRLKITSGLQALLFLIVSISLVFDDPMFTNTGTGIMAFLLLVVSAAHVWIAVGSWIDEIELRSLLEEIKMIQKMHRNTRGE